MSDQKHRPTMAALVRTWGTYPAADLAEMSYMTYSPKARMVRLMRSCRIDPQFAPTAFRWGADGVPVGGCHPRARHYQEGIYGALRGPTLLRKPAADTGIEDERLRPKWISAPEADKLKKVVDDLCCLGPRQRVPGRAGRKVAAVG